MRRLGVFALAVALFFACSVTYTVLVDGPNGITSYRFVIASVIGHGLLRCLSHLALATAKTSGPSHFYPNKNTRRQRPDTNGVQLSIFKGREAKLNRTILLTLFQAGPLVVYDITKQVKKRKGLRVVELH